MAACAAATRTLRVIGPDHPRALRGGRATALVAMLGLAAVLSALVRCRSVAGPTPSRRRWCWCRSCSGPFPGWRCSSPRRAGRAARRPGAGQRRWTQRWQWAWASRSSQRSGRSRDASGCWNNGRRDRAARAGVGRGGVVAGGCVPSGWSWGSPRPSRGRRWRRSGFRGGGAARLAVGERVRRLRCALVPPPVAAGVARLGRIVPLTQRLLVSSGLVRGHGHAPRGVPGGPRIAPEGAGLRVCGGSGWRMISAQFLHAWLAILAAWMVGRAAGSGVGRWSRCVRLADAGWIAGAFVLATPWTIVVGSLAYTEMPMLALGACGLVALDRGLARVAAGPSGRRAGGAACGFADGHALFHARDRPDPASGNARPDRPAIIGGMCRGRGHAFPWLTRNALVGGNPVFRSPQVCSARRTGPLSRSLATPRPTPSRARRSIG